MKLGVAAATQIASFLCGDGANSSFPYRTGRDLTTFFTGLGHGYRIDDYSSRGQLAENAMVEIDRKFATKDDGLAGEIVEIIVGLMSPLEFVRFGDKADEKYGKALVLINRTLSQLKLEVVVVDEVPVVQSKSGTVLSSASVAIKSTRKFTFAPSVFQMPDDLELQQDLVAVMMPFGAEFTPVYAAITASCEKVGLRCKRADDIWKESNIIQDIFELICVSKIVVVDYSHKNTNVFYEVGIAHTLGKNVVPITQSMDDIPFDLKPHRTIKYHSNTQGLQTMSEELSERLLTLVEGHDWKKV